MDTYKNQIFVTKQNIKEDFYMCRINSNIIEVENKEKAILIWHLNRQFIIKIKKYKISIDYKRKGC